MRFELASALHAGNDRRWELLINSRALILSMVDGSHHLWSLFSVAGVRQRATIHCVVTRTGFEPVLPP